MAHRLRPLGTADGPAVLALARSLGEWFNAEGLAAMEREFAAPRGLALEDGKRLIGFATWQPRDGGAAELTWMGVDPALHRRGLGTRLVAALVEEVRCAGHGALEVHTVADSCPYEPYARTRAFYRARGFRDHRVDTGFWGPPGDAYDRLVLRRSFGPSGENPPGRPAPGNGPGAP